MIEQLVLKNRSYRRFYENISIPKLLLERWVNLARLSPSGGNRQALRFYISHTQETNNIIFPKLSWASYLTNWQGPGEGERPSAYIIILADPNKSEVVEYDAGVAAQSILLGAVERGFGGCIVGSVKKKALMKDLSIHGKLKILMVLALGRPKEETRIEDMVNDDIHYWRDDKGIHHVPKRSLESLIINAE